jgi:benzoate-CoA ligase family protein
MGSRTVFNEIFLPERATRVAVLYEQTKLAYDELRLGTIAVAESLSALGIGSGDRVAILLSDSPEFITSFVAIMSIGGIAVPINLALGREDQLFILKDCGAAAAIVEAAAITKIFASAEFAPELKNVLAVRRDGETAFTEIRGLAVWDFAGAPRAPVSGQFPSPALEDADAFILYTSGSTGEPKGAVHCQGDIFYTNETFGREVLELTEDDRLFSSSRLPFAYGLGNSFTFPLLNGITTILCREKPSPDVVQRILKDYRPTVFFGVPVVYKMLLDYQRAGSELDTSSLRLCVSAGEALSAQLGEDWQRIFGVEVLDGIGSTEMLHMFMSNHHGDVRYGSSGTVLRGYEARLVDHEGASTAMGQAGNLWIRGDSAAARYWQRPETSAETFVDGWVRTGDLYLQDADGYWWHQGRSDDCFKPTGQWVSPIEVENILLRHDAVRAVAVVEGFDQQGLSCVCAFVVTSEACEVAEESLRAICAGALPRFKQPRRYLFVADLPYTATGKLQRFKLRKQLKEAQVPEAHVVS